MALTFDSMGWKTTFGESEFLKWEHPDLETRKTHDFRPDYEAINSDSFFACEIKVGFSRKRKSELSTKDPHIKQFKREAKNTVESASIHNLKPIFSLALGCDIPKSLLNILNKTSKNFIFIHFIPSKQDEETCHPIIVKTKGYQLLGLRRRFNSVSQKKWSRFDKYNSFMLELLNTKEHKTPRSAAEDIITKIFNKNPEVTKLQNLFSSLSVGKSLKYW